MSRRHHNIEGVDRRNVLKLVGSTALASGFISSATANTSSEAVSGLAYDTLSDIVTNRVSGKIKRTGPSLTGSVELAGFNVPMDRLSPARTDSKGEEMYVATLSEQRYLEDDSPLEIRLFDHGDHFSGTMSRPSGYYGTVGFHFLDEDEFDSKAAKKAHTPAKKWEEHPATFSVPEKGVPTDSAPMRIIEWTENQDDLSEVER